MPNQFYDFSVKRIDGADQALVQFKGKVLLVVNVASKCGLTPQYDGLEKVYEKYNAKGFEVLGFPANEFAGQEPGTNAEIQEFCRTNFGVKFPLFQKIIVKGQGQHPLYKYLTDAKPTPQFKPGSASEQRYQAAGAKPDIVWNFEKFIVGRDGKIAARIAPDVPPEDPIVIQAIESELNKK
jgi:glutathione peroxidase